MSRFLLLISVFLSSSLPLSLPHTDEANMQHVTQASSLLGLSKSALLTVLTKRHVNFAGTVVAKHLTLSEAMAARDAVASHLYLSVFKQLLSSLNTAVHNKFRGKHNNMFGEKENDVENERDDDEFDMLAAGSGDASMQQHIIAVYDFPGFEYAKPSNISGLCKNYINERLYQYYAQSVFRIDAACFADNHIIVPPLVLSNNDEIVKLLESKTNGIFTIFNDQMKLKSRQLDAKVASVLYSHHTASPIFDGGKKERKRLWFKIRHYNYSVSYDVKGFKHLNKIQPSAELVEFLRSSTIPYVQSLLGYCEVRSSLDTPHLHGLEAAPRVEEAVTRALERSMGRGFISSRPSFQSTSSTRNFMLQHQSSDVVSVYSVGQDDDSVGGASISSRGSRRGGSGKPATLASLTHGFMEEVIAEVSASQVHVVLCVKPNDVNTCKDFDNYAVSRQLAPYELQRVLRFYTSGYPYRVSLSAFSNRYSILATVHKISGSLSKSFMKMLLKCRAMGRDLPVKQSHNLIKSLLNLVSNLPELETQFSVLTGKKTGDFYFETVQTNLKVCDDCVMLTALAYCYLEAAHTIALSLIAHLFQRFYRQRVHPLVMFQMEKVKNVCRGFVARKSWAKKKQAVIKIQSVVRMFTVREHYNYEKQILGRIIRAQAVWRGRTRRALLLKSPPQRPAWMSADSSRQQRQRLGGGFVTPGGREEEGGAHINIGTGTGTHVSTQLLSPPGERLDATPLPPPPPSSASKQQPRALQAVKSYTTEEEDSPSNEEEEGGGGGVVDPLDERGASQFMHHKSPLRSLPSSSSSAAESQRISELQSQLEAMKQENRALRRVEKKFIQQSKSLNHLSVDKHEEEDEGEEEGGEKHLGNKSAIILRQNTANDLHAEQLRCAYDGTRLLPDYDLYSARVLNAVRDDLSFLLKPTVFYKFGHQGSVRKALICVSPCFHYIMWKPKNSIFKKSEECKVDLRKVWSLAKGQTTPAFKEYKGITHGPMPQKLSFSLIFGFRSLDFCALDGETYQQWFQGLQYIVELINGDSAEAGIDKQYYRRRWNQLDKHRNGVLNRKSVITLVASLGVKFTNDSFLTAILRSSIGNSRVDQITFSQCSSLLYQLTRRPDLEILWTSLVDDEPMLEPTFPLCVPASSGSGSGSIGVNGLEATKLFDVIGVNTFRKFWHEHQGRQLTVAEARVVIKEGMGGKFDPNFPVLSYMGFMMIMNHEKNDVYDPVKTHHSAAEMRHPLSHYYIACSDGPAVGLPAPRRVHNSSSSGNVSGSGDSSGDSSSNPYSMDIKRGCRALELRCYEAEVTNGGGGQAAAAFPTDLFMSPSSPGNGDESGNGNGGGKGGGNGNGCWTFKETLLEISRVAFTLTHFPLLLFVEFVGPVSMGLQQRAAEYVKKVFDDGVLFLPSDMSPTEDMLPSPKHLKQRVLLFLSSRERNINTAYAKSTTTGAGGTSTQKRSTNRSDSRISAHTEDSDGYGSYTVKAIDDVDDVLEWREDSPPTSLTRLELAHQHSSSSSSAPPPSSFSVPPFYAHTPPSSSSSSSSSSSNTGGEAIHASWFKLCHHRPCHRVASHDMTTIITRIKTDPSARQQIQHYNTTHLTHIFTDKQVQIDASYGRMVQLWDAGVPCLSLCHHYPSLATKLHHGKFRANGGCGFVPKPRGLRGGAKLRRDGSSSAEEEGCSTDSDKEEEEEKEEEGGGSVLIVHVISGQELPDSMPDIRSADLLVSE
jgi:hypothetical protein